MIIFYEPVENDYIGFQLIISLVKTYNAKLIKLGRVPCPLSFDDFRASPTLSSNESEDYLIISPNSFQVKAVYYLAELGFRYADYLVAERILRSYQC